MSSFARMPNAGVLLFFSIPRHRFGCGSDYSNTNEKKTTGRTSNGEQNKHMTTQETQQILWTVRLVGSVKQWKTSKGTYHNVATQHNFELKLPLLFF